MAESQADHDRQCALYEEMIKDWDFYTCAEQLGLMSYSNDRTPHPYAPARIEQNMEALRKKLDVFMEHYRSTNTQPQRNEDHNASHCYRARPNHG